MSICEYVIYNFYHVYVIMCNLVLSHLDFILPTNLLMCAYALHMKCIVYKVYDKVHVLVSRT